LIDQSINQSHSDKTTDLVGESKSDIVCIVREGGGPETEER